MRKSLLIGLLSFVAAAQPPKITYQTPNTFYLGENITPLEPVNSGGIVEQARIVTTFAGAGIPGSADGQGALASFNLPTVVTIGNGILYVVDRSNNKIRKITEDGNVSTFAGTGAFGSADGAGNAATFFYPDGAVADSQGNLFVSDQSNHKIRKITPDGIVTTFAGSGSIGPVDGQGAEASFYYPAGMAIDNADNLYIADYGNNKIRKITAAGLVTTFAGTGAAGAANAPALAATFNGPTGVAVDADGNVFVADYYNHMIRKIALSGDVSTIAGSGIEGFADGTAAESQFDHPAIVTV
ncbi:MAG: hypothetical protein EOO48_12555, partial [Flavobacterium sp.]